MMSYTYNLAGGLVSQPYPSGRVVTNSFDEIGRFANVSSKANSNATQRTYANAFTYNAAGAVSSMRLGNGRFESTVFNSRLQPTQIALGTSANNTSLLKLNYTYGVRDGQGNLDVTKNNGNVESQTITVPTVGTTQGFTAVQSYTYDALNRLLSAKEMDGTTQNWKQTFSYDKYGNRMFDTSNNNTTTLPESFDPNIYNPTLNPANNRMADNQGYEYDSAGNVTKDATNKRFVYDGENKQTSFGTNGSSTNGGSYYYDGDGKRVKKIVGTETTIFVYNVSGQMVAEYTTTAPTNPTISYLTSDTLGSPRINTDQSGQVSARHDYMPFGEEIIGLGNRTSSNGYQDDDIRQKFTQYERDNETSLNFAQARYHNESQGRFTSPDPAMVSASVENPQTWNRYVYVLNNPLKYSDPLGLWEIDETAQVETETTTKKGKTKTKVTGVTVLLKKQEGDDVKSLAKQLNISEKAAQKILDKADSNGNIRLSQVGGNIGSVFKAIENRIKNHEQDKIDNPSKGDDQGFDCTKTATLIGTGTAIPGTPTVDAYLAQTTTGTVIGPRANAESVADGKQQTGDIVRFALNGTDTATHFATFLMFNRGGEPVVFSKSGIKGPNEFGTAAGIGNKWGYGNVTPLPRTNDKTGYYRPVF